MKMTQTGIVVIGIDHGYGNIKTANTITPTGVTAYDKKPAFEGNILFYDNTYYKIGDVHKTYIPDKSEDMDNYICTLYGIARELSRENTVKTDCSSRRKALIILAFPCSCQMLSQSTKGTRLPNPN